MDRRLGTGIVAGLVVTLGAVTLLPTGSTPLSAPPAAAAGLTAYTGCDKLVADVRAALLPTVTPYGIGGYGDFRVVPVADLAGAASVKESGPVGDAVGAGPTGTNLQEAGVDEPDVAKLAGDRLVVLGSDGQGGQQSVHVVTTGPQPVLLGALPLGEGQVASELLLDGPLALVVAQGFDVGTAGPDDVARSFVPAGTPTTVLRLADLSDPAAPRWTETLELDGAYVSARLTGGAVRVVTRSGPDLPQAQPAEPYGPEQESAAEAINRETVAGLTAEQVLPTVRRTGPDGAVSELPLDCTDVSFAPEAAGGSLLVVTTLRPSAGLAPTDSTAVVADGDVVYAAADRLVVATSRWGTLGFPGAAADEVTTELHAFDTTGPDTTTYVGSGSVDGSVLGRWALSSHEGSLRVATTTGQGAASSSSVAVLQERGGALEEVGRVDGLGPGEQIQAVRYLGDLATVVTFRQTDPLYVLDLGDPAAPRLVGELKVPGFSTYLHPVGDDRLLGLGMEADLDGRVTGMQASLFDLSDLSAPLQTSRLQLGAEAYSEALQDSRAFTYDPERRLALLPVQTFDGTTGRNEVVGIRVGEDGLLTEAGRLEVPADTWLRRVLVSGDVLQAVAETGVVAATEDLVRTGGLDF